MPSRKRASSVLNGDGADDALPATAVPVATARPDDALALVEEAEAEAEAAEAAAAAAQARARALKLRRQVATAAAVTPAPVAEPAVEATGPGPVEDTATIDDGTVEEPTDGDEEVGAEVAGEPVRRRRRLTLPRIRLAWVAATLVVLCTAGFLGASVYMVVHHRQVTAEHQRSAELSAAARQGVVTLMSLNYNSAEDDVKRIIDNTTGDFRKDFQGQADEFAKVAQESKVITEATVNATAVQSMTKDGGTVLVAVTTQVSNAASKEQQPRSWRLRVDMARDGEQLKLAKVEFVP
jgi:Mce-associated membrane protein